MIWNEKQDPRWVSRRLAEFNRRQYFKRLHGEPVAAWPSQREDELWATITSVDE